MSGDFDVGDDGGDGAGCSCEPVNCTSANTSVPSTPGEAGGPYSAGGGACENGMNGAAPAIGGAGGASGFGGDGGDTGVNVPPGLYGGGAAGGYNAVKTGANGYARVTFQ